MSDNIDSTTSGSTPTESFSVYLVHGNWTLDRLDTLFGKYGTVGQLSIVFKHDKTGRTETSQTLCVCDDDVYYGLLKDGYSGERFKNGLKIAPYRISERSLPREGHSKNLFVQVPDVLKSDSSFVFDAVTKKLEFLAAWHILDEGTYHVKVPVESRQTGRVKVGAIITFNRDVSINAISLARTLLNDTFWPEKDQQSELVFQCHWARVREPKKETPVAPTSAEETSEPVDPKKVKAERKKRNIQKLAKKAAPVPKPSLAQPVLKETVTEEATECLVVCDTVF